VRPLFSWKLRSKSLELGKRTLIMGVVNATPDSFSDAGMFLPPDRAIEHALKLHEDGADILDIGGESTRPGANVAEAGLPSSDELQRVMPVIEGVLKRAPQAIISVDTYKARVAREAVNAGAEIVNDVSAMAWDGMMRHTCAELGCGAILMHMRGRPEQWRTLPPIAPHVLIKTVAHELSDAVLAAKDAGIQRDHLAIDPGFGFGKNFDENYPLLAHLDRLHELGLPIISGTSRKSFIGRTVARGREATAAPDRRLYGTLASVTASILAGAHVIRVHDVLAACEAAAVADEIVRAA
jgi:dihydropteroate synthase